MEQPTTPRPARRLTRALVAGLLVVVGVAALGAAPASASQGNVFISDNVVYEDLEKDAIATIALRDAEDEPDEFGIAPAGGLEEGSGNLRFGDPEFGTTFRFAGFMFAEHDVVQ